MSSNDDDDLIMHQFAWKRVALIVGVCVLGVVSSIYDWHRYPPVRGLTGTATYMRNAPGDLRTVLWLYAIEASVAVAALQPWRHRPRRHWIGLGAATFGMWGALRWLIGLHSPTVMFGHDVVVLVVALTLAALVVVYGPLSSAVESRTQVN
jgi:hypothetical protein